MKKDENKMRNEEKMSAEKYNKIRYE